MDVMALSRIGRLIVEERAVDRNRPDAPLRIGQRAAVKRRAVDERAVLRNGRHTIAPVCVEELDGTAPAIRRIFRRAVDK